MQMSATRPPLRIAIVGAGVMGTNHLRVLRDFDESAVTVVGVSENHPETLARAMRIFHVPGFADYHEMIERVTPDLVVVVTPTATHYEVASFALEHDCHTLIEKPIARTVEEALALVELGRAHGVILAVGHVERFNPAVRRLKHLLEAGTLGTIFQLHARRLGPFPPRIRDVGVTLDLATHDLDAMRYLIGDEVDHVYAETQQRVHQQHEDLLLGLVRFRNGVIGMLDVNWLTPTKVRELSVTGDRGMYLVNYLTQDLYFYENDYTPTNWDALRSVSGVSEGTMTRLKVQKAEPLALQYQDLLRTLDAGTAPTVTGEDGLMVLRLAHQLIEATRAGEVVRCPRPTL